MHFRHATLALAALTACAANAQIEADGPKLCDQHPAIDASFPDATDGSTEPFDTGGADCVGKFASPSHPVGAVTLYGLQRCTGTLVHEQVVLTAAHCVYGMDYAGFEFRLGPNGSSPTTIAQVVNAHVHDQYDPKFVGVNDIAVLYLAEPLRTATPIPFSRKRLPDSMQQLLFMGYGNLSSSAPGIKRCLTLPVKARCAWSFSYGEKDRHPCHGDSGGPALSCDEGRCEVAGITSWGDSDCGRHGVSMDVGAYKDYILARISEAPQYLRPPALTQQRWPEGLAEGGEFTVTRKDATRAIGRLFIPKNATLRFAPDVDYVSWVVEVLEFGEGATIDLSAPAEIGAADNGSSVGGQPPHGIAGAAGFPGGTGRQGRSGRPLSLLVKDGRPTSGSLWIRTDGAPGLAGGTGGAGQGGGGSSCGKCGPFGPNEPKTNGGRGGAGGQGGNGGFGGDTSQVSLNLPLYSPFRCQATCGVSARPDFSSGNDGRIVVFGAPGCGGPAGRGGPAGPGGDRNRSCPCGSDVFTGEKGPDGRPGVDGETGTCGELIAVQPAAR